MAVENLGPAERFAAGAIGAPGKRTFYLEVTASAVSHWFLCEKDQVAELAEQGLQLLIASGLSPDQEAVGHLIRSGLEVREPDQPRFRIGSIGVGITQNEFLTLQIGEVEGDDSVTFLVTPEQFQAMAVVALQVVASGRPICPRCGLPEDPEGHNCPWVNGHHPPA
ncbi:MAG TPA: DUF3090 family protein [Acidimicrobiia bacterium]|nr:DUF3090 family protein [Acidimicrobiia bacterium]